MSMSENAIRTLFDTSLNNAVTGDDAPLSGLPVAWGNMPKPNVDDSPWLRATLRIYDSVIAGIGESAPVISDGAYVVGVFAPVYEGEGIGGEIREAISALFRNKILSGDNGRIHARAPRPIYVSDNEGGWHHVNVDVPFITLN